MFSSHINFLPFASHARVGRVTSLLLLQEVPSTRGVGGQGKAKVSRPCSRIYQIPRKAHFTRYTSNSQNLCYFSPFWGQRHESKASNQTLRERWVLASCGAMIKFLPSVKKCILGTERRMMCEVFLQSLRKYVRGTDLLGSLFHVSG